MLTFEICGYVNLDIVFLVMLMMPPRPPIAGDQVAPGRLAHAAGGRRGVDADGRGHGRGLLRHAGAAAIRCRTSDPNSDFKP